MRGDDTAKQDIERTANAIRDGDRVALARAITLVESAKPEDQARAEALLDELLPSTGKSIRVGISGVPGKWPWKNSSLTVTFLTATSRRPASCSTIASTSVEGYR